MSITPASLRARFPEVCEDQYDDARLQSIIDEAGLLVTSAWGKFETVGLLYLSMHLLWLADRTSSDVRSAGSSMGPMASKTVGAVSASYAVQGLEANSPDFLYTTTTYGRKYLEYRRLAFPSAFMVV